jgi:hypothetical protein
MCGVGAFLQGRAMREGHGGRFGAILVWKGHLKYKTCLLSYETFT